MRVYTLAGKRIFSKQKPESPPCDAIQSFWIQASHRRCMTWCCRPS